MSTKNKVKLPPLQENGSLTPALADEYNDKYAKSLESLNYSTLKILDEFEGEAVPLLRDLNGAKPAVIQTQLREQRNKLVKMVAEMSQYIGPLSSNGYRIVVMETVKKLMDAYSRFILETVVELRDIVGDKAN